MQTPFPVVFNTEIRCAKLIIEGTQKAYNVTNRGLIYCRTLILSHEKFLVRLYNKAKIFLAHTLDNQLEVKRVNLENYILINEGKFFSNCGLKFTWDKALPKEVLGYSIKKDEIEEARIQNNGIITCGQSIELGVPVYIGEKGIIKTSRKNRIKYSGERIFPVYAIVRIPQKILLSYTNHAITPGQLGEETAKYYYAEFEDFIEGDEIGTFKANNSDNGLDVICDGNPVIIHESKNFSDSSFHLSKSNTGLSQCSKQWLQGHFCEMVASIQKDKKIIKEAQAQGLEELDIITTNIIKQKKKTVKFNGSVVAHLDIKENNGVLSFKKKNLILNGSSIHHTPTAIQGMTVPFYYCQRNIDAAYNR